MVHTKEAVLMLDSPVEKLYAKSQAENMKIKGEVEEFRKINIYLENQLKGARLGREL